MRPIRRIGLNSVAKRTFQEALMFYQNQSGLKHGPFAEKLGLKLRFYQKLYSGKSEPSLTTLAKVLDGLRVSFEEFFLRPLPPRRPPAIQPQSDPRWPELARLIQYYGGAERDDRLLSLYMLSENPDYIDQYAAIDPEHAADADALKRILSTS